MEQKKLLYDSPLVEYIEVEVEKGFANSNGSAGSEDYNQQEWQ